MSERDNDKDSQGELREQSPQYPVREWPPADDEISLFDLWDALMRRRWLILGVTFVVTALAVIYAITRPTIYPFRSVIEVGTYIQRDSAEGDRRETPIESPEAVRRRLANIYIPRAREALTTEQEEAPEVELRTDEETPSNLFVLYTEGKPAEAKRVKETHRRVVDGLVSDHNKRLSPIRQRAETRIAAAEDELEFLQQAAVERSRLQPLKQAVGDAKRKLEKLESDFEADRLELKDKIAAKRREASKLQDRRDRLSAQIERIAERKALAEEQLAQERDLVEQLEQTWSQASGEIGGSADAMTLLTVGGQINTARNQVADLKEQLRVGFAERRSELEGKLQNARRASQAAADQVASLKAKLEQRRDSYQRARSEQRDVIEAAKTKLARARANYENELRQAERRIRNAEIRLDRLTPTQGLSVAQQGLDEAGTSSKLIAALGLVLGGMLGIFAAFFAEFVSAAQRRYQPPTAEDPKIQADGTEATADDDRGNF